MYFVNYDFIYIWCGSHGYLFSSFGQNCLFLILFIIHKNIRLHVYLFAVRILYFPALHFKFSLLPLFYQKKESHIKAEKSSNDRRKDPMIPSSSGHLQSSNFFLIQSNSVF
jgi:hypothetical protein